MRVNFELLQVSYVVDVERERDAFKLQCTKLEQECASLQQQLRNLQSNSNGISSAGGSDSASMDLLSGVASISSSEAALDLLDSTAALMPKQAPEEGESDLLGLMPMASPSPSLMDAAPQSLLVPETNIDESAAANMVAVAEAKAAASAQQVSSSTVALTALFDAGISNY